MACDDDTDAWDDDDDHNNKAVIDSRLPPVAAQSTMNDWFLLLSKIWLESMQYYRMLGYDFKNELHR